MNIALWIVQGLLAALYLMAGSMKTFRPIDKLAEKMPWVKRFPVATVRAIGVTQILGALGLVLPMALGIAPILTPIAALGLALTQVFAIVHHAQHNEIKQSIPINGLLLLLAAFVAWGRF